MVFRAVRRVRLAGSESRGESGLGGSGFLIRRATSLALRARRRSGDLLDGFRLTYQALSVQRPLSVKTGSQPDVFLYGSAFSLTTYEQESSDL